MLRCQQICKATCAYSPFIVQCLNLNLIPCQEETFQQLRNSFMGSCFFTRYLPKGAYVRFLQTNKNCQTTTERSSTNDAGNSYFNKVLAAGIKFCSRESCESKFLCSDRFQSTVLDTLDAVQIGTSRNLPIRMRGDMSYSRDKPSRVILRYGIQSSRCY